MVLELVDLDLLDQLVLVHTRVDEETGYEVSHTRASIASHAFVAGKPLGSNPTDEILKKKMGSC